MRPEPINVVYVINSLGTGGAERFLCDLARHLDPDRFRAQVLCLYYSGQFAAAVEAAGVPVHVIGVKEQVVPANWVDVWRWLGQVEVDIVHTHLPAANWYGLPAGFLRRVPVRISHLHSSHWSWQRKLRWLDRMAETFASTSLACSVAVEQFAITGLRYPPNKLEVVPNGIDLERFQGLPDQGQARESLGLQPDGPILICVASLTEEKGQTYLLEAMQRVHSEMPEARLLLVGRDRAKTDFRALADEKGLGGCVSILGTREDIPLLLTASDISVLPSLREGLPLSLMESAAAGLPVVATSVGGIPEIVENGVGAILVPPGDHDLLADALLALLRDPGRRRAMGGAARHSVEERFDIRVITERIQELYLSLLARDRRAGATVAR